MNLARTAKIRHAARSLAKSRTMLTTMGSAEIKTLVLLTPAMMLIVILFVEIRMFARTISLTMKTAMAFADLLTHVQMTS